MFTIEQLKQVIDSKAEGVVDGYTLTTDQCQRLVDGYNALQKQENKDLYLTENPFRLLSFLGIVGFSVVKDTQTP